LFIDADAQKIMTVALGNRYPDELPVSLADIMQDVINDNEIPEDCRIPHHKEGFDLMPSNIDLSGIEIRIVNIMSRENVLKSNVNQERKAKVFIVGFHSFFEIFFTLYYLQIASRSPLR